ncbi:MAG: DUF6128 domain-containing protein [Anaerobutyricum sp.]|nr:DUF6128 domain-containing protein [Anaerobutyricum sp.]
MADYQRILSYLYRYENAEKKECRGFIKAEQKTGSLKLTIQIEDDRLLKGMILKLCFYEKQEEGWQVWHLDSLTTQQHKEEMRLSYTKEELPPHFLIKNQSGVLLYYQDSFYYGSIWIGEEIPARVLRPEGWHNMKGESQPEEDREKKMAEPSNNEESGEEPESEENEEREEEPEPEKDEGREEKPESGKNEEREEESESEENPGDKRDKLWINSLENSPAVDNIYNPAFYKGYRISTNQLETLGEDGVMLSQNQFLLKGYRHYRHLLAGKIRYDGKDRYCIGVPGIYENREKYMAEIYQFPIFLSAAQNRVKTGGFGYWLHLLQE